MAGKATIAGRLDRVRRALSRVPADGLIVTSAPNVTYLSGFSGDDSALLVTARSSALVTDSRYTEQADAECPDARIVQHSKGLLKRCIGLIRRRHLSRVAVEESIPHGWYVQLRKGLGARRLTVVKTLVEDLRQVKDSHEVGHIRAALAAAQSWWRERRRLLKPGRTELEVAADIVHRMSLRGAGGPAFPAVVAVGARASLPHAPPTGERLTASAPVLVDWGADVAGYKSDLTRVLARPSMGPRFREVYGVVLEAQEAAIAAVRPGVTAGSVDAAARSLIARAGYGRQFGHGTGHGVGLEVHELPRIRKGNRTVLEPGMVFTIEPGIYLPGRLGVRIEDLVLVTEGGSEVLSSVPKQPEDVVLAP